MTPDQPVISAAGGFISPGGYSLIASSTTPQLVAAFTVLRSAVIDARPYQSFSAMVQAYCSPQVTAGAILTMPVTVQYWADAAGSMLVDSEVWWMWVANSAANAPNCPFTISGPLKGGFISFQYYNYGGTAVNVVNQQLYGSGRPLAVSDGRQYSPAGSITASGISTLASTSVVTPLEGLDNLLAQEFNNSIAAGSTYWWPMPLMSGTVSMRVSSSQTMAHVFIVASAAGLQNPNVAGGASAQGIVWEAGLTGSTEYATTISVGRFPLYFAISASSTTATVFSFSAQGIHSG